MGNAVTRWLEMARHAVDVFLARETPLSVKLILAAGLVYVLSPYDLIPEWIPVVGVLDDLALAALLIAWASRYRLPDKH
jgi:uncharacterized membrane protein YkvA (DUF1232 family)